MQMRIDETLRHQIAAGVDFSCAGAVEARSHCGDAAVLDADVGIPIGRAAQASMADRDIERLSIHLSRARRCQSLTRADEAEDRCARCAAISAPLEISNVCYRSAQGWTQIGLSRYRPNENSI
jgi:hypothetical protein